jgi:hypothetical protein
VGPRRAAYRHSPSEIDYQVSRRFAPPGVHRPVSIIGVSSESWSWTCSYQTTRNLRPSHRAPAYRVEWALTEADFRAGHRESLVVPGWYESGGKGEAQGPWVVKLGALDCRAPNFDWKAPIYAGLVALEVDGTESPEPTEPVRVEPIDISHRGPRR